MISTRATRLAQAGAVLLSFAALAGCQVKAASTPPNFISADPSSFVVHHIDRYDAGQVNGTDTLVVVVAATYTNGSGAPEIISADKFELIDQTLEAVYVGLSGGDIRIPTLPATTLAAGKSIDVTLGFRVPASMSNGRLAYYP